MNLFLHLSYHSMSAYSMKGTRQISKESTRKNILNKTRILLISNGISGTSTKDISVECEVAHGTLFAHFNNREQLIGEVLKGELMLISKQLYNITSSNDSLERILENYLDLIISNEALFVIMNKEFPFIGNNIRREIITTESIIKNLVLRKIKQGLRSKQYKDVNPTTAVSFFFGTLNYYLSRKEYFTDTGSVIQLKREELVNTFLSFLNK